MSIFNSLGSNYNLEFVLKALLENGAKKDSEGLKTLLEERYGGEAILFYKGREALTMALKMLNLADDSKVAINGFTCVAVFNAIRKAGFEPVSLDLGKDPNLNFSPKTLEKTLKSNENIKVVVIQNTFGYPCNIEEIQRLCRKNNLVLIEDMAHSVGTKYESGKEAGTVGDFVVLSFSQDKIIDAVSGGALVIRSKKYINTKSSGETTVPTPVSLRSQAGSLSLFSPPPSGVILKDRIYPLETYKIRTLYKLGLGKPYHFLLKKFNLLSNVLNKSFYYFYSLPNWHAGIALYQFELLEKQLSHRRKIAKIYFSILPKGLLIYGKQDMYDRSSNLRFPIMIKNRQNLLNSLKKNGIYLSDIWYDDVAPECPNAVEISKKILNLPTHINVPEEHALKICELINLWLKSQ